MVSLRRRIEKRKLRKLLVYDVNAYVDVTGEDTVSLIVIAKNEKELFKNLSRGGYYPPFVVTSVKTLSEEMSEEVFR